MLLIQGVGIAGVPVLKGLGFEEAHGREIARLDRGKEVLKVIFMVCQAVVPNFGDGGGPRVSRIGRQRIVLEEGVMRDVIACCTRKAGGAPLAARRAIGFWVVRSNPPMNAPQL